MYRYISDFVTLPYHPTHHTSPTASPNPAPPYRYIPNTTYVQYVQPSYNLPSHLYTFIPALSYHMTNPSEIRPRKQTSPIADRHAAQQSLRSIEPQLKRSCIRAWSAYTDSRAQPAMYPRRSWRIYIYMLRVYATTH